MKPLSWAATRVGIVGGTRDGLRSIGALTAFVFAILLPVALFSEASYGELVWLFWAPFVRAPADLLMASAPILLVALAFSYPMKAGFFNIGGDGQVLVGAFAAGAVPFLLPSVGDGGVPAVAGSVILALLGATLAGSAWAGVAGVLRERFEADEVIVTLLLNLLAPPMIGLCVGTDILGDPGAQGLQTRESPLHAAVAELSISREMIGWTFSAVALVALLLGHLVLWWTYRGLRLRVVGSGPAVAELCGIQPRRQRLVAVLVAGFVAGLAGAGQVFQTGRFSAFDFNGWGLEGIIVALLGQHRAPGIFLAALYMAALRQMSVHLQVLGLPYAVFVVLQGLFLVFYSWRQGISRS